MEDKTMMEILHNNCKKEQLKRHNEQVVNRIKNYKRRKRITNILVAICLVLMCLMGLVARIDNNILSACYILTIAVLWYIVGKRWEVI